MLSKIFELYTFLLGVFYLLLLPYLVKEILCEIIYGYWGKGQHFSLSSVIQSPL